MTPKRNEPGPSAGKPRILIVEDEALIALDLEQFVRKLGYDAAGIARDSVTALECVERQEPDLVLMDIVLASGGDGVETARRIYEKYAIPVIYITSHTDPDTFQRVRGPWTYGFIVKPVNGIELYYTIETALHRKRGEDDLRDTRERYRALFEGSLDALLVFDLNGGFVDANLTALDLLGADRGELARMNFFSLVDSDFLPLVYGAMEDLRRDGAQRSFLEIKVKGKRGRPLWVEMVGSVLYRAGSPYGIQVIARDITGRKETEERINRSLREKDVLLHEVHHRVKNNLQLVSSLLDMVAMRTGDPVAGGLIEDVRSKILTIALIHTYLYESERFDNVDFRRCMLDMSEYLGRLYNRPRVTLTVSPFNLNLPVSKAIPCALVLNELLSNAYKHAFGDGEAGAITVTAAGVGNSVTLSVSDNGRGIPPEVDVLATQSMGYKLVRNMVGDQLKGSFEVRREGGTEIVVRFDP